MWQVSGQLSTTSCSGGLQQWLGQVKGHFEVGPHSAGQCDAVGFGETALETGRI